MSLYDDLSYYRNKRDMLNAKIRRLETAYTNLHTTVEEARTLKRQTRKIFSQDVSWKGDKYEDRFVSLGEYLDGKLDSYNEKLDDVQDSIYYQIAALKKERDGVIGWITQIQYKIEAEAVNLIN